MSTSTKRNNPFVLRFTEKPKETAARLLYTFQGPLERLLKLSELARLYDVLPEGLDRREFVQQALALMNIKYEIAGGSLENIPREGPVIVVANHPFGGLEGMLFADLLNERREDVKILANWLLGRIEELRDYFLFVDPFGTKSSFRKNIEPIRQTIDWVKNGGLLGVFPAGEVSSFQFKQREVSDPEWSPTVARIVRKSGATVVPVFFEGRNRNLFQLAGMIHPMVRTALLPRELANKQNTTIRVKIGQPLSAEKLASYDSDETLMGALRLRTYLLADYQRENIGLKDRVKQFFTGWKPTLPLEPIVKEGDRGLILTEVEQLPSERLLVDSEAFAVYYAKAKEIPHLLREIGRLREITFREVSEGTGLSIDLDPFDNYYEHLFVWSKKKHEIVGAYRLGKTDVIRRKLGTRGLYTYTLFKYKDELLDQIDPALELGRSFVRPEYQRSYQPLLLLWRGIGAYVVKNPKYSKLFGPVSINNEYESISRRLIITFLKSNNFLPELAKLIRPRNPLKHREIRGLEAGLTRHVVNSVEEIHNLLAEIEDKQKQLPVLLRQYLKMGGKLLGFNVDESFGNVLDGLLLVDLVETDPKLLARYLGKQGSVNFLAYDRKGAGSTVSKLGSFSEEEKA